VKIATLICDLKALAQAMAEVEGTPGIKFNHVDAKSHVPVPHTPRAGTGVQSYVNIGVTGSADMLTEGVSLYLMDSTVGGNENTNTIINELMFDHFLNGKKSEVVLVLCFDCCKLNRTGAIAMGLAQFFVDTGMYEVVVVVFLQRYHSKQLCDRK
jgi:hypothetical protein